MTGVTVGRRDIQVASVGIHCCTINMDGYLVVARKGEDLQFGENGRVVISILEIGPSQVRLGIKAPSNIKIDRWDRTR